MNAGALELCAGCVPAAVATDAGKGSNMKDFFDRVEHIFGSLTFRLYLFGLAGGLTAALCALERWTAVGVTIAVAFVVWIAHLMSRIELLKRG